MAVYKVPQDVEADDKLIGPFSFRQFIYLIVVVAGIAIAWFLSQLFLPLFIIPLPVILFFGALALPLRKDQPMETYLAAIVSFYLKPRRRMWDPDGQQALVEITAPHVVEVQRTKDLSQEEAERRLSYLANVVDTRGWAVRGVAAPIEPNTSMNTDLYFEAQQVPDVLDRTSREAQTIGSQLNQANERHHQELIAQMRNPAPQPIAKLQPVVSAPPALPTPKDTFAIPTPQPQTQPASPVIPEPHLTINPYPTSIHQSIIQPISDPYDNLLPTPETTSEKVVSPDIISLANNPDLSIETIAREANRIKQKEADDEVVISLR